jgi:steroid 5-alpha reductase family enzyme
MEKSDWKALGANILVAIIAAGLAIAVSIGGKTIGNSNFPIYALAVIIAFAMQWIVFIPSFIYKTEKYYDITGSATYTTVIIISMVLSGNYSLRSLLIMSLVLIWTLRLGVFLFRRIIKAGEDKRFREMKKSGLQFLRAWTIQGLWVSFTAAAALAAITADSEIIADYNFYDWIMLSVGLLVWLIGFAFEATADRQKKLFINNPDNQGKFINVGLWSISRHPNYFGEITIWVGMALITLPTLQGWRFFALISPIFVFLLITQVSGVPLLENYADKKWGGQADYEEYKKNTPVLIPKITRKKEN